ncbi:9641_t:CDS:2 [Funneliformis geosporum]|uniref:5879_t:CDS:1 n=1 Tax=Funneliformis geosporum TaxID=1117311 RepID=A0A9W4WNB0_9GLOM|nr:9641_t:CDS:2 [Funneliformis geosporum]CAI2174639.1 5879_t:CDS:2 [Funneliformis geosporum]
MRNCCLLLFLIGTLLLPINNVLALPMQARQVPTTGDAAGGTWQIIGNTGVNAMHIFLSAPNKIVLIDKLQNNQIKQANGQPAVSTEWNLDTNEIRILDVASDTFCSAGSWLGNGTMLHTGGDNGNKFLAAGQQTLRFYDPAVGDWVEIIGLMTSKRWYPTMLSLANGKVMILGGSISGTGLNRAEINNPTYTIWPPTDGVTPDPEVQFQFLIDTLPYNLYVMLHLVPNSENKNLIFVLANKQSILYDLDTATIVKNYPEIAVQRTYPQTGTSLILPLYPETNYLTEVMVCGGQKEYEILSAADASCGRMDLNAAEPVWTMDDFGGLPRVMPDSNILVNGEIIFLNGAGTGYAGFRKGAKTNPLWSNNNPTYNPVLYNPTTKIYTKMNPSSIARMYHSVATLIPDGSIFVAGSNPQGNVATDVLYPTEYRAEIFNPPYLLTGASRPSIVTIDGYIVNQGRIPITYGNTASIVVQLPKSEITSFTAAIIHNGFVTHSQHMGQRYVGLVVKEAYTDTTTADQYILTVELPPNPTIIAPGPSYIYILNNNFPCVKGVEVLLN